MSQHDETEAFRARYERATKDAIHIEKPFPLVLTSDDQKRLVFNLLAPWVKILAFHLFRR